MMETFMIEVDIGSGELIQLRDNSLERCLRTLLADPDKALRIDARKELRELLPLASKIWYAASGTAQGKRPC